MVTRHILNEATALKKPRSAHRRICLSAISVLYLLCLAQFLVQWYFLNLTVVMTGYTRKSMFFATIEGPRWIQTLDSFLFYSSLAVSDGLLVSKHHSILLTFFIRASTDMEVLSRLGTIILGNCCPSFLVCCRIWSDFCRLFFAVLNFQLL